MCLHNTLYVIVLVSRILLQTRIFNVFFFVRIRYYRVLRMLFQNASEYRIVIVLTSKNIWPKHPSVLIILLGCRVDNRYGEKCDVPVIKYTLWHAIKNSAFLPDKGFTEFSTSIEKTTWKPSETVGVHPVHAVYGNSWQEVYYDGRRAFSADWHLYYNHTHIFIYV